MEFSVAKFFMVLMAIFIVYRLIKFLLMSKKDKRNFNDYYSEIIDSDSYKVKGRFD